jgi:voltage-gated potassium channel
VSAPARRGGRRGRDTPVQSSAAIFLVLRRMRAPLIVLILILAVTVLGLTLVPGDPGPDGRPWRMSFFEAFYFMSYTATTIGFGELPQEFSDAQRMWVTLSIYLTVIGWAYALGTLLALLQDHAFRGALARQQFVRKVTHLREPFLLIAGFGRTAELVGRALDALDRRFVVIDVDSERIEALDLDPFTLDVPGLTADAGDPDNLRLAGLAHPRCEGVLALTNDDEVNLTVTMTAALLRPGLPVIARTVSPPVEDRMRAFGDPVVVNPFDRFGDHLRMAMRQPSSYRLLTWLSSGPSSALPPRHEPPRDGHWIVCGHGRFGREMIADLHAEGLDVTVIDPDRSAHEPGPHTVVAGDGSEPEVLERAGISEAVGLVAGTGNDTTNLSLLAAARRLNRNLYVAARQNQPSNAGLFAAMDIDLLLVPSELVAHEVYAQLSSPLLWRFLQRMPEQGDAWADALLHRLAKHCGQTMPPLWKLSLARRPAPALQPYLREGRVHVHELLRDPENRDELLSTVPLLLLREGRVTLGPEPSTELATDDELLFVGEAEARRAMETTALVEAAARYVVADEVIPDAWIWREAARHWKRRRTS